MSKTKITAILIATILTASPTAVFALAMPQTGNDLAGLAGLAAQSYIVADAATGDVLISKNADVPWPPASLTKLVTALVVLDTKPRLAKSVVMTQSDQDAGQCQSGGACIRSKAGVKFTVDGLFHATLLPSANNAASALARSTGLSAAVFADRMNKKAQSLGATASHFNEPTGLNPQNQITAADYAKIVAAAFKNPYLSKIAGLKTFALRSANNFRYNQVIKNTDKLLANADITVLGAKTGYLDESKYNFSALISYRGGQKLAIVVLGEDHLYTAFDETKLLASLADQALGLALINHPAQVLDASTP